MRYDAIQRFLKPISKPLRLFLKLVLSVLLLQPFELSGLSLEGTLTSPEAIKRKGFLSKADRAAEAKIRQAYSNIPIGFEKNQGQTDPQVRFLARGEAYCLFLTPAEAVLKLFSPSRQKSPDLKPPLLNPSHLVLPSGVVRMRLVGGNRLCRMEGQDQLAGKTNYFKGANRDTWRTGIHQYSKVRMEEVYPGIDMVYYGNRKKLEYDFVAKQGSDPKAIRLKFEGMKGLKVDKNGDLEILVNEESLVFKTPLVYQEKENRKTRVNGRFVKIGLDEVGFELGEYRKDLPLVIDPVLDYSTYLGGSCWEWGNSIAVDGSGNAYVTGYTQSTNFPITAGAYQTVYGGGTFTGDAFVTKLNSTGSALVYSTYLGGSGEDEGFSIAVNGSGNAFVTGTTQSTNFPTTPGAFQTAYGGGNIDGFVSELNATGSALVYSTYLGGSGTDYGQSIAVDGAGNAYVTGYTGSNNFPTTAGAYQMAMGGGVLDAFVTKLNPTGTGLVYSTYLGGSSVNYGYGIAIDGSGNAYVTGSTKSVNFPTTAGAYQTSYIGSFNDAFVAKLNSTGSALVYSTYLGGGSMGDDTGQSIALDSTGAAYIAGSTQSGNFPTTAGAFQTSLRGVLNLFVAKFNPAGSVLVYSTYVGSTGEDGCGGIAVDGSGNAYVSGLTFSGTFPTTGGAYQTIFGGGIDAVLFEVNPTGTTLLYSTFLGGNNGDGAGGVALDGAGNVYVAGRTLSTNFPITAGAFQTTYGGSCTFYPGDAFVSKFTLPTPVPTPTPTSTPTANLPCQGSLYVSRNLYSPKTDFPPLFLRVTLCATGRCSVMIYNTAGEHIKTLNDTANQPAGLYQFTWDGKNKNGDDAASGAYIIRFQEPSGIHLARVLVVQ